MAYDSLKHPSVNGAAIRFVNKKNEHYHKTIKEKLTHYSGTASTKEYLEKFSPGKKLVFIFKLEDPKYNYAIIVPGRTFFIENERLTCGALWTENHVFSDDIGIKDNWVKMVTSDEVHGDGLDHNVGILTLLGNIDFLNHDGPDLKRASLLFENPNHVVPNPVMDSITDGKEDTDKLLPSEVYIALDGDNIGARVAEAVMENDLNKIRTVSEQIHKGQELIKNFVNLINGELIVWGGDDGGFIMERELIPKLEPLRSAYEEITGYTLTIGIGDDLKEGGNALVLGKLQGKDRIVTWDKKHSQKLLDELAVDETPAQKLRREGLIKKERSPVLAGIDYTLKNRPPGSSAPGKEKIEDPNIPVKFKGQPKKIKKVKGIKTLEKEVQDLEEIIKNIKQAFQYSQESSL